MYTRILYILLITGTVFSACGDAETEEYGELTPPKAETIEQTKTTRKTKKTVAHPIATKYVPGTIETGMIRPEAVVEYAKTLLGTPYLYGSTHPSKGFDCSGFVTHVFNHFNIKVPRSSVDYTHEGKEVPEKNIRPGDLVLFTGTDSTARYVGHMGIVVSHIAGRIEFIHSSSGKAKGVVITPLERYYRSRFLKVIRIFPDSFFV